MPHMNGAHIGALGLVVCAAGAYASFSFDDIGYWIGSGANEAALVIDWNGPDGADPVSLAWGFRWDGVATGQDMLTAVINADARLFGRFASFGFGDVIIGLGYDLDGDGFAITDGTDFGPSGLAFTGTSDGATATDPGDYYAEGWNTGFWSYTVGAGEPFNGGAWEGAMVGFGDRVLADGDWDGYRFAPDFAGEDPRLPVAAVPGAPALAPMLGFTLIASRRRR
jgi:hypothetical protein